MTIEMPDESEVKSLALQLAELESEISMFEVEIMPLKFEKETTTEAKNAIRAKYEAEILALATRDREITEALYEASRKAKALQARKDSLERQQMQLAKVMAVAADFAALEKRWDLLTAGAPWREFFMPHQLEGAQRITYHEKMIVADTMGLGKTLTSIMALDLIKAATKDASEDSPYNAKYGHRERYDYIKSEYVNEDYLISGITKPCGLKVLYFCPSTMLGNVKREINRWAPHRSVVILGGQNKVTRKLLLEVMLEHSEYVVICNYEAWRKDKMLVEDLIDVEFDTCIIDEAHNIKDRKTSAFKGIERIVQFSNIPFVVPMTGTPILNRPQELFTLLTLVDNRTFNDEYQFLQDYCWQNPDTKKWAFAPGGLDRLGQRISNRYLRRTKEQAGIKLPPRTIVEHILEVDKELYPNQARARDEMRKWGSIMLDPERGRALVANAEIAVITRLRQVEVWPAGMILNIKDDEGEVIDTVKVDIEESQKIDYIARFDQVTQEWEGLIPDIVSDERVIVYSQFIPPLMEIKRRLELMPNVRVAVMTGDTTDAMRNEIQMDFDNTYTPDRANSKYDVVLCHYKVGGVGANMTAATQMIILDEEWNPGKRDQAYDRNYRIGQDKPTTIHILRDAGTIDNWMAALITEKEALVEGFHTTADSLSDRMWQALKDGEL